MKRFSFIALILAVAIAGCALRGVGPYVVHPEAKNGLDSRTYDTLLFSKGFLLEADKEPPKIAAVVTVVSTMTRAHPIAFATWEATRNALGAQRATEPDSTISFSGTLEGFIELARLTNAGNKYVSDQAGKPIDPNLVRP